MKGKTRLEIRKEIMRLEEKARKQEGRPQENTYARLRSLWWVLED